MKTLIITTIFALMTLFGNTIRAEQFPEEYLGLPGDNLNLYAVMKLFQESETLEAFERSLNDENSRINNLDLNGDNYVDYLMVFDYQEGDLHTIVLRVALNKRENQDVAFFTVERFPNGTVQVQLIGDEALYGRNYIVEPIYAENGQETPNPGYIGNTRQPAGTTVVHTTTYEVATWPLVRFIFRPTYVAWHSSWYWGYRPVYWNPWRPYYWHFYYGYHSRWYPHYYSYYRHWDHPRNLKHHNHYYSSVRVYSPRVTININKGNYKNTYSRPDLRSNGEQFYSKTNGGRREVNSRGSAAARNDTKSAVRTSERTAVSNGRRTTTAGTSTRGSSAVSTRTETKSAVRGESTGRRTESTVRQNSSGTDTKAGVVRRQPAGAASTPARSTHVQSSSRSKATAAPATNRSATPEVKSATTTNRSAAPAVRPAATRSRSSAPAAKPATSTRSSAPAARKASPAPAVKSASAPQRSAAPTVKQAPAKSRSAAPAVRSSSRSSRSSAPAAKAAPSRAASSSRSAGASRR